MKHNSFVGYGEIAISFNWTKVELKLWDNDAYIVDMNAFNWTKVELKLTPGSQFALNIQSFNWTKVELKLWWNTATFKIV